MTDKWIKNERVVVIVLMLSLMLFLVSSVLRNQSLRHVFQLIGNLTLILVAGKRIITQKFSKSTTFLILYLFFDIIITMLVTPLSLLYSQAMASVCFFSLVIILGSDCTCILSKKDDSIILFLTVVVTLVCMVETRHPNAYIFEDGRTNGALVLGTTNSAYLGMILSGIINLLLIYYTERKKKRWFLLVLAFVMLYLQWLSHSRGAFLATIVVVVYSLFFVKAKMKRWFVNLCLFFPFATIFLFMYLEMLASLNIKFLGKPLSSGRGIVYQEEFSLLKTPIDIVFGKHNGILFENAHNGYLMIFTSIGVAGMILFVFFISKMVKRMHVSLFSNKGKTALVSLLSIFIMSGIEALPLMGRFPYSLYFYIYLIIIFSEMAKAPEYIIQGYLNWKKDEVNI